VTAPADAAHRAAISASRVAGPRVAVDVPLTGKRAQADPVRVARVKLVRGIAAMAPTAAKRLPLLLWSN